MLTAANAVHATVVSSNWFGVKVSYLKDLVMISGGICCGPMALICFLEWPANFGLLTIYFSMSSESKQLLQYSSSTRDSGVLKFFDLEMGHPLLEVGHGSLSLTPDEILQLPPLGPSLT